jgi:uncharacterized protein YktA (UPF0223 family)
MNRMLITIGLVAALALPALAAAKPTKTDRRHAAKECRAERGDSDATREAFADKYKNFGHCVSRHAREERAERRKARSNAARECRAERADTEFPASHEGKAFDEYYGTNPSGRNAFGKCVSSKARAKKAELDAEDEAEVEAFKNAAKECDAERADPDFPATHDGETFAEFYGRNRNDRNAFGKCVSSKR